MASIPANATAITLLAGQSITGSFAGFIGCTNTVNTYIHFRGLRDAGNVELCISGSPGPSLFLKEGVVYPMFVTSASLDITSANVVFFT
jgi:hypothetical protein